MAASGPKDLSVAILVDENSKKFLRQFYMPDVQNFLINETDFSIRGMIDTIENKRGGYLDEIQHYDVIIDTTRKDAEFVHIRNTRVPAVSISIGPDTTSETLAEAIKQKLTDRLSAKVEMPKVEQRSKIEPPKVEQRPRKRDYFFNMFSRKEEPDIKKHLLALTSNDVSRVNSAIQSIYDSGIFQKHFNENGQFSKEARDAIMNDIKKLSETHNISDQVANSTRSLATALLTIDAERKDTIPSNKPKQR